MADRKKHPVYSKEEYKDKYESIKEKHGEKEADKKLLGHMEGFVEAMEGDDKKVDTYIESAEREKMQTRRNLRDDLLNFLDGLPQSSYRTNMAEEGMRQLIDIGFPKGWDYHCIPTKVGTVRIYNRAFDAKPGIITVVKDPKGQVYVRSMLCSYNPVLDLAALGNILVSAEDVLDRYEREKQEAADKEIKAAVEKVPLSRVLV